MRIFHPKVNFESLSIWKMHFSFQSLEKQGKSFHEQSCLIKYSFARSTGINFSWVRSTMQWNWFPWHQKKGKDDLHTCPNFPFPHFSSQKKKFWCIIKKCAESSDVSAGNTFLHIGEEYSYFIFPCNSSLNFHSLWVIMQMVNKGSC